MLEIGIENVIEFILAGIGIIISIIMAYCAYKQNKIQRDNIKIQLFDKRYSVYKSVLDSITIIKRDNWERYILFYDNDISKQMILIEENLYKSTLVSTCLFDKELHQKIVKVNNAFCNVAEAYKNMLITNLNLLVGREKEEFLEMYKALLVSGEGLDSQECNNTLKEKFPKVYISVMEFSKQCDDYLNLVDNLGIAKAFDKYIIVNL